MDKVQKPMCVKCSRRTHTRSLFIKFISLQNVKTEKCNMSVFWLDEKIDTSHMSINLRLQPAADFLSLA